MRFGCGFLNDSHFADVEIYLEVEFRSVQRFTRWQWWCEHRDAHGCHDHQYIEIYLDAKILVPCRYTWKQLLRDFRDVL